MADGFRILEEILRFAGIRHNLIVSNIANVDTPGYRAKDIEFKNLLNHEMIELTVTSQRHISSGNQGSKLDIQEDEKGAWKDKNNVELDREVAKLTENALLYEAGLNMLSAKIRMFKNALRRQL
ncbi:MAG: flagellar basal body rod protein FlgB [Thermodesulfovibrionales bacterium]|nr:flagellar basal body rod protein FlgB [Thermodesulfovibrionales bacterium]